MDDLIRQVAENDDGDLGTLNIVVENIPVHESHNKQKAARKMGKKERLKVKRQQRRELRKMQEADQSQEQQKSRVNDRKKNDMSVHMNVDPDKTSSKSVSEVTNIIEDHNEQTKSEMKVDLSKNDIAVNKNLENNVLIVSPDVSLDEQNGTHDEFKIYRSEGSRRKHTEQSEGNSAEYMATYHARPLEMDRRAKASAKIKKSSPSEHIFEDNEGEKVDKETNGSPFGALGLHERLVSAMSSSNGTSFNFSRPTLIQKETARALLGENNGRSNLFVQSETGSGKTLAYLLPILNDLAVDERGNLKKVDRSIGGTRCIVLCPTRELATQTLKAAERLCLKAFSWLVPGLLVGGEKRKSEKARLRKGVSILIATPGRLLDHLGKTECLTMALKGKLEWIVLDEADRLLDMGLSKQVEEIVQYIRAASPKSGVKRNGVTWRAVLVSATVTTAIQGLAKKTLGSDNWVWARATGDAARVAASKVETADTVSAELVNTTTSNEEDYKNAIPRQLAQQYMVVSAKLRLPALIAFLVARIKAKERTVIFMATCDIVDYMYALFNNVDSIFDNIYDDENATKKGIFGQSCGIHRLHGNIPRDERHLILSEFGNDSQHASVMFATDVAARGLNLPGIDWILQYDAPSEVSDFVHRAGRAARAGQAGHCLIFLLPSEVQYIEVLKIRGLNGISALSLASTLQQASKVCSSLTSEGETMSGGGYGRSGSREGEAFSAALQTRLEEVVVDDDRRCKQAAEELTSKAKGAKARRALQEAEGLLEGRLVAKARQAFTSYMRAYPTKEKSVRHIFSSRALHLGHIARSFALKDAPKTVMKASGNIKEKVKDDDAKEPILKSTGKKRNSNLAFSNAPSSSKDHSSRKVDKVQGQKRKRTANGSFAPILAKSKIKKIMNMPEGLSFSEDDIHEEVSKKSARSIQAQMTSAARRIQSGMEYF